LKHTMLRFTAPPARTLSTLAGHTPPPPLPPPFPFDFVQALSGRREPLPGVPGVAKDDAARARRVHARGRHGQASAERSGAVPSSPSRQPPQW
jgi:hypothetical protein